VTPVDCLASGGDSDCVSGSLFVPTPIQTRRLEEGRRYSEEKRELASDINTAAVDGLKVLDPERPIREADIGPDQSEAG